MSVFQARGATFVWDLNKGTDGAQDGSGNWTDGASNWFDETTPQQNQTWSNSAGNTAAIGAGGAGGTIIVSGTVNANGLIFRAVTSAYTLTGGTISLASGSAITVQDGSSSLNSRLTINSTLSGSNITLQKATGAFALVTIGSASTLSGTFSLTSADTNGLFVQVNSVNSLPSATLTSVNVGTNTTLVLGASGNWQVPFTLSGSGAGGRGAIRLDVNNLTLSGAITLAGSTLITQNTSAVASVISSNIGESTAGSTLSLGTQGTSTGTIALAGNNTFTGGLSVDVTNVRIDGAGALNSTTPNKVTFASSTLVKSLSLNGNSITLSGLASTAGAGAGTVRNQNATAATLTINSTADAVFAGSLADGTGGGALSVIKTGSFAQSLSGTNTFTGGLTLNQGGLNVNSSTALGATASTFTINGGTLGNSSGAAVAIANSNAIVINGDFTATLTNSLDLGTGAVSLGTAAGTTRTITVTAGTLTLSGGIADGSTATGITKAGAGTLALSGTGTFSGLVTVSAGNLLVLSNGALGSTGNGVLISSTTGHLQLGNSITVTGESVITPYVENVSGNNTWAGSVRATVGATLTLDAAAGSLLIQGNVNAASTDSTNHTFTMTGSGSGEVQGVLSNTLAVNKTGTGTWVFSGANTYTSATSVNAGTLQVGKAGVGQTGTGAVTVAANASLSGTGVVRGSSFTLSASATLYAGDGTTAASHGTLTFTPVSTASYNLAAGSKISLDLTTATASDGNFGGNAVGSAGYNTWLNSVTGVGGHDRLVFNGSSGTLTVAGNIVVLASGYTPHAGDVFNLLDWSALLTTDFSNFSVGTNYRDGSGDNGSQFDLPDISASGLIWDVSQFTTSGNIAVVPEPGRASLLLLALGGLMLRRRRA
ncbi:beta strand repeat-containing protein [Prosthecobacter vanneervenii]|uniref:Autotransporter-associated beta strand protein n=1 Tax=Prosthecobacter vanneervenii TaxID=48466 RepID=A0A7W7YAP8_9BACT|nr:autotransporter-associated beta strand repeat-containing protein [Prosthecobacter vanneervenii]MBB5032729.1 autotransporter-associated beta strand protein [Prosthecobacter vanneervenii]